MALVRPENQQQARLVRLLRDGPRSRVELGDLLGLSRTTLTTELDQLVARGLVETAGPAASRGGRRSSLLRLSAGVRFASVVIAADRITVAVTDGELNVLAETGEPAEVRSGPEAVIGRAVELVGKLRAESGVAELTGVGVALPGPVDNGTSIAPAVLPGWQRFPVRDAFATELGCPALVDNDANVLALGEQHAGIGRTFEDFLYLKLGTAIGCGLVLGGSLYRGATSSAGDIAHLPLDEDGPTCVCGEIGCLEAYCGDAGLVKAALAAARSGRSTALAARNTAAGTLTVPDVAAAAIAGDPAAQTLVRDTARRLGQVLVGLVSFFNPGIVVIGGAPDGLGHILLAEVRGVVYRRSAPVATGTMPIVLSDLADRAAVVGGARLASDHVFTVD
ncbi:Sugar kinase of the NBD/HSP70 family, may contain an N-terminal HTH domain [Micromonospora phaseoli]|uniref:Sugar kinase of the NBD/HSP70 family, may contain an N-terminal HTH domain n=1 Tax=Micromonospora phaseoli TaxID=1144548 RepID=A0A1H7CFA6_9ACTN|nr:ROK family transcriptional regulator [Micromonospora phaseoli]PZV97862.1 putative NBD/HSP70 family sugar kinase [Micromonospora phaseoli]GIJ78528.1 sugar kinase [Micromonospora phaseoli]SEJ88156.1 Sugar kinase of the NBD/HSP70 family, may contain an N-terminal HTH domain [Micromonospora phaseoli]